MDDEIIDDSDTEAGRLVIDAPSVVAALVEVLASGLYRAMAEKGAGNYMAFQLSNEEHERFLALFIKLPEGKTPMELEREAKAEAHALRYENQMLKERIAVLEANT